MNNVQAYKELEADLASKLEYQYMCAVSNEDVHGAYQILGKLMAYKLINKNDERLSPKFQLFKKAGIDPANRFKLDLRKDDNYIPEWLFAEIPYSFKTKVIAQAHSHQHIEFGGVHKKYDERELDVEFKLLNTPKSAKDSATNIAKIFEEETGKTLGIKSVSAEAEIGYNRIYEISITSNVQSKYKVVGYMVVSVNTKDKGFSARLALKSKVFDYYYIDLSKAFKNFTRTVASAFNMGEKLKVVPMLDYRKAMTSQIELFRKNREELKKYENTNV